MTRSPTTTSPSDRMSIDDATPEEWNHASQMADAVNAPVHYNKHGKIQCIDAIKEVLGPDRFQGYLHGNIMKYAWRYDVKGKPVEDLRKLRWYTNRLICELIEDNDGV